MAIGKYKFLAICLLALMSFPAALQANDEFSDVSDSRISGFGTLGFTYSDDDQLGFRRDFSRKGLPEGQWKPETDSLLGLQLDLRLTQSFSAAIQVVGKDRADNSLKNSVEWAYVRFEPNRGTVLRAGRVGFDVFLLSEYRNLGFAYLWSRPPVEFYGVLAFDYLDGVDAAYSLLVGSGTLRVKAFAGVTRNSFASENLDMPIEVDIDPIFGGSLSWENNHWRAQLGVASLRIDASIGPTDQFTSALQQVALFWPEANAIAEDLQTKGGHLRYLSGGLAYENSAWVLQSELGYIHSDFSQFGSTLSGYLSAGYKVGGATFFAMGAIAKNNGNSKLVPDAPPVPQIMFLREQIQGFYDVTKIHQHSLSLGLRWDFRHNLALKTQWDHTWVKENGGGLFDQAVVITSDREVNIFSISLDFVFK